MTKRHSELPFELVENPRRSVKHEGQAVHDWNKFSPPAFLERYVRNDICFCLKCRVWFSETDFEYFCTLYSYLPRPPVSKFDDLSSGLNPKGLSKLLICPTNNPLSQLSGGDGDGQETVFVLDVHVMDNDQGMRVGSVATSIRLIFPDDLLSGPCDALYASVITGSRPSFNRAANGEALILSWRRAIAVYESCNKMVKARSHVMDDLARNDRKSKWRPRIAPYEKEIVSAIRAEFTNDLVRFWIAGEEGSNVRLEICDAFVGPLNFGPAAS
jgi:hypothetical protein